ncbi:MAG: ATP-binding protein [Coriobacteriales bacterium]|jgi:hypothetical protein|nr:ATP-binding protein [Coriobacteriales bacterium]
MGFYLNPGSRKFQQSLNSEIYVDKTGLIGYTNSILNTRQQFICISRPRRFGKSMGAEMLAAYYGRGEDSSAMFTPFEIASHPSFTEHLNRYEVLFLNIQDFLSESKDMEDMIELITLRLTHELTQTYPEAAFRDVASLPLVMEDVSFANNSSFIVIIDEWDCIFRVHPHASTAQNRYLDFLRLFLKDKGYIALAYMTGILPIKKYGTHSALNMFYEFSMINQGNLARFTGFTQEEVQALCKRYNRDFSEMEAWYNGYELKDIAGKTYQIYSPRSVVQSLQMGRIGGYWTSTETYEALKVYIDLNYEGLRDTVTALIAGQGQIIDSSRFVNDMTTFNTSDDVLTLLVHLGYLGYRQSVTSSPFEGEVFIPNREIQKEFLNAMEGGCWPEALRAVAASRDLLKATWDKDAKAVARGIEEVHLETAHITYNSEAALSYTLSLAYFAARDYYTVVRELPSGKGFADLAFIPRQHHPEVPAMLIELKWDKGADTALTQIQEKRYPDALSEYQGTLLLVGISYDKETRKHECVIQQA